MTFWDEVAIRHVRVTALDGLEYEVLDGLVEDSAFGAHIDPVHAMVLGLVPDCEPEQVTSAGNAAGTGARIALLNRAARTEIEDVVRRVEKIETATEPRFQEHFVGAMGIPHATDPFPRLGEHVALPERAAASGPRRRRTRERSTS